MQLRSHKDTILFHKNVILQYTEMESWYSFASKSSVCLNCIKNKGFLKDHTVIPYMPQSLCGIW